MPYTDSFLQNYAGFQNNRDDFLKSGSNADFVEIADAPSYDPQKVSANRVVLAVAFSSPIPQTSDTTAIYPGLRNGLDRTVVTYNEGILSFDGTQHQQLITFDPFTLENTTASDVILAGIELVDSGIDGPITDPNTECPELLTLTGGTLIDGFYNYTTTTVPGFRFCTGFRVFTQTEPNSLYVDASFENDAVFRSVTPIGTGSPVNVWSLGTFSIARYNFPETIVLAPDETIDINLGTVTLNLSTDPIVCI